MLSCDVPANSLQAAEKSLNDLKSLPQTSEAQLSAGSAQVCLLNPQQLTLTLKEIYDVDQTLRGRFYSLVVPEIRNLQAVASSVCNDSLSPKAYPMSLWKAFWKLFETARS